MSKCRSQWIQIRSRLDGGPLAVFTRGICFSDMTDIKLIEHPFWWIGSVVAAPIFISLILCIMLATSKEAVSVFANHCGFTRWLPTLSSVIAPKVSAWAWQLGVCLTCVGRLVYFSHAILPGRFLNARIFLWFVDVSCLLGLSFFSSMEALLAHEVFFLTWLLGGLSFFLLTLMAADRPQLAVLRRCLSFYIAAICTALPAYLLHDSFCVPYALTTFAVCEYSIVTLNVFMHVYICMWNFATLDTRWWNHVIYQW
jgi:hypothetical protein